MKKTYILKDLVWCTDCGEENEEGFNKLPTKCAVSVENEDEIDNEVCDTYHFMVDSYTIVDSSYNFTPNEIDAILSFI